jgi:hypothetical protein
MTAIRIPARRRFIGALASLACMATPGLAAAAPPAQEILAASDAVRNPQQPFSVLVTLIEYRNGKQADTSALSVYSKVDPSDGQYRSLLRFVAPARDAGKLMLKSGNDLWYYDPSSQASIRLSPQQRLLGQAANGDVVTVNLARDYKAELLGEESLVDGEKVRRDTHRLELRAAGEEVTYDRIEMWIDKDSAKPLRARFYAESGRLLKTAYYRKFAQHLGRERPTEVVIIDGLDPKWVTVMRYSEFTARDVPDAWLQRDYLPRFKPE